MPPKQKVKIGKLDARKTREAVYNHPTQIPPTEAEEPTTQAMNQALDEVLMAPHQDQPPITPTAEAKEEVQKLAKMMVHIYDLIQEREKAGNFGNVGAFPLLQDIGTFLDFRFPEAAIADWLDTLPEDREDFKSAQVEDPTALKDQLEERAEEVKKLREDHSTLT